VKHFGDITKIHGYDVPPVDIITGGSPCQDLSVAGKRAGLEGERSGLFMDQIRIVKEMRNESYRRLSDRGADYDIRDIKPRMLVWENVAGAFTSGNPRGADFKAVLEEIVKIVCKECPDIPIPKEGWHYAGCIDGMGDDGTPFSISWRLHDAQYWGVPQRRRRVCVVADFGGNTASKLLFELWGKTEQSNPDIPIADIGNESEPEVQSERQGLSRNTEESGNEGEGVTGTSENDIGETISFQERAGKPGGVKEYSSNESEQELSLPSTTNQSSIQDNSVCYGFEPGTARRLNPESRFSEEISPTLRANMGDNQASVCYGISPYDSGAMKSSNPHSGIYEAQTTRTLDPNGGNPNCNQGGMAVVSVDRSSTVNEGRTNALLSDDKDNPNICYGLDRASFNQGKNAKYNFAVEEEIAQPLVARGPGGVMTP